MNLRWFMLAALLVCLCTAGYSQTTFATITGTVTDATGAVVPNATVTATNTATNIKTTAKTNDAGVYTIPQLIEGTYEVRIQAAGFKEVVVQNVRLAARDIRRVDATMELGSVETTVEVSGGATLIETETARIADTKNTFQLNTLPTNDRGLWTFLSLSPSLQQQPGSSVVRFAGSRVNQGNWSIDGTTFSDGVDNTQTGPFANYIESFQEVHIDLSNNSAEFGSIGQVTIVSKSGTNKLHGTAFDYYQSPWFRARGFFDTERSAGIRHWPGGSIGGPVYIPKIYNGKDKTFFFFSYETSRGSKVTQNLTPTVPLAAWRTGNFAGLTDANGNPIIIKNPFTGQPFPNNQIPANLINPASQKIQEMFYPLPNFGDPNATTLVTKNFREALVRPYDPSTYWTTRIDHKVSDSDSLFGRFTWSRLHNRPYEGNLPTIGRRFQQRDDRAATVSYTHTFTPTLLNEARWGFGFNKNPIIGPVNGAQIVQELGLQGLASGIPSEFSGLPRIGFSGLAVQTLSQPNYTPVGYRTHTEEIQDHLSWFRGRHNAKFGVNVLRAEYDSYGASSNLFGNLQFSNRFTGFPYADFLLGIPTTAARAFPPIRVDRNRWAYDFYALDDFKVTPRLTLNLGLRYELHLNWRENNNQMAIFDVKSGSIVVPDGSLSKVSPIFPKGYVPIVEASSVGLPGRTLIKQDKNNFAPRIGVAYRPFGNSTVFRAGWGIFYDVVPLVYALSFGGAPYQVGEPSFTNPANNPQVILPRVFPTTGTGGPTTVGLPMAENPGYRTPYSMQYNFTIEQQVWNTGFRFSYIGTSMRKGAWAYNYNSPVPDQRLFIDKPRPFPNYPEIDYVTNGAGHQYNGFTAEARRDLHNGLYLQGSWTWARDRYDLDYNWDFDSWMYMPENPFDRKRERAVSPDVPTHRFNINAIYQLPFGRGRAFFPHVGRAANLLIGGWEISAIFSTQTGQFLTPFWTGPDPVGIAYTDSSTPAEVTLRPDLLKNPNLPKGQNSIDRWFDTSAFGPLAEQLGRFGTSAKGVIKGPGVNVWHAGIHKEFLFSEGGPRLRWELTATNVFNHPNWANPGVNMTSEDFGVIGGTGGVNNDSVGDRTDARSMRMGLRFTF